MVLLQCSGVDQHRQRDEKLPRNKGGYTLTTYVVRDYIERHAVPAPCSLLSRAVDKEVASTRWSHYLLQARDSLPMSLLQRPEMHVPSPTARHLHHLEPAQFRSHSR